MRSPNADNTKASRLEQNLEVTFLEAYYGIKKSVSTPYKTLEVYVPAGVDNGSRIELVVRDGLQLEEVDRGIFS